MQCVIHLSDKADNPVTNLPLCDLSRDCLPVWLAQTQTLLQDLTGDASSLTGEGASVETFSSEIVKGVLPSRHVAAEMQTGVPYFMRLAASNSLGFGEYGQNVAVAKAAQAPAAPGNLSAGVALHVDEVSLLYTVGVGWNNDANEWGCQTCR